MLPPIKFIDTNIIIVGLLNVVGVQLKHKLIKL